MSELIALGLERREAVWIVEEFFADGEETGEEATRIAAQRRLSGEPLQYVFGHWPFRSLDLELDARVLIPRPETEMLVDLALAQLLGRPVENATVIDLGCGSGAIGLSLLNETPARGVAISLIAVDSDEAALDVARRNAEIHDLEGVRFVHSLWFSSLDASLKGYVDLIVANPPYVSATEFKTVDPVLHYEPYAALVSPDALGVGGFADLAQIIDAAPQWLVRGGSLVCEHGSGQGAASVRAALDAGFATACTVADLAGRERALVAVMAP